MNMDTDGSSLSLILTIESEHYAVRDELTEAVGGMADQLAAWPAGASRLTEFLVLYDEGLEGGRLREIIDAAWEPAAMFASPRYEVTGDLGYYEQKNRAAEIADGESLVFMDGDLAFEAGTLQALVEAHDRAPEGVVTGNCYIASDTIPGRAFALFSTFDLRRDEEEMELIGSIHANNFAVRRELLREHPFPDSPTMRRDCHLWAQQMIRSGRPVYRESGARIAHPAPEGREAFIWRALRQGHDDYWMFVYRGQFEGAVAAAAGVANAGRTVLRGVAKLFTRADAVGLKPTEVPIALLATVVYGLTMAVGAVRAWLQPAGLRRRLTGESGGDVSF